MGPDTGTIEQAYRFALDPTPTQAALLNAWSGASRFWFNQALAEVKHRLDQRAAGGEVKVPWSYKKLCSEFDAKWRAERAPWQRPEGVCGSYMAAFESLGLALKNFTEGRRSRRKVGFPKFRKKGQSEESILFQDAKPLDTRHVHIEKRLGPVRTKERLTKLLRALADDPQARVLRATLKREHEKWYVSFTVKRSPKRRQARRPNAVVGVDLGIARAATTSTRQFYANARPLHHALRRLRRLQRSLDRQRRAANPNNYNADGMAKRGCAWRSSGRMRITQARIRALHERVANLRREQAHLLTTMLTREFGVIGAESIATKNLMKNRRLARHIADVGWGLILSQLAYKARWAESIFYKADRYYPSSKTCHSCSAVKAKLSLSERVFTCEHCNWVCDRDLNAALNLAQMTLQHARAEGLDGVFVARAGRETLNARGGRVSPGSHSGYALGSTDASAARGSAKAHSIGHPSIDETLAVLTGPSPR
jgi:putative transposase